MEEETVLNIIDMVAKALLIQSGVTSIHLTEAQLAEAGRLAAAIHPDHKGGVIFSRTAH